MLHPAPCYVWARGERSLDRQLHAACSVPALFHSANDRVLGVRLLVGLWKARLLRWRYLRTFSTEPHRQSQPHPRNLPCGCRARPRCHRAPLSQLVIGKMPMSKILACAAFAVTIVAAPTAMAAERTITLAVENMYCAACPSIVKGSLEAVPGVAEVAVSYKDKTATIVYDDAKADVSQLTSATT